MNPLTEFKKIPILPLLIALALVVVAAAGAARAAISDFNGDGHPDYVLFLQNAKTPQTAILYLNNNVFISASLDPTSLPTRRFSDLQTGLIAGERTNEHPMDPLTEFK